VATITRSSDIGSTPATASASRAAWTLRVVVFSSSSAMRRSRIPVRDTIHSSEVSTSLARSSLVITRDGAYIPHPVITAFGAIGPPPSIGSAWVDLDEWLLALHQRPALD